MANLEQTGSRIPDVQSAKLTFSLTVTFYLMKTENRTKKFLTQLSHIVFIKEVTIFAKKLIFCKKKADIIKIKTALVLKGMFSKTTYVCVPKCQISSF